MRKFEVRISSSRPVFIEADADSFGAVFAEMSDEEQVEVFRSIVEKMKPFPMQWDYIAIMLEKEENKGLCRDLSRLFPDQRKTECVISDLLEALKYARRFLRAADHDVDYVDDAIAKAEGRS